MRQQSPGAAATHDAEDGVENLAQGVYPGSSGYFRWRKMGSMQDRSSSERSLGHVFLMRARVANHYPTTPFRTVSPGISFDRGGE